MANINRDYLIVNDVKKSNITLDNGSMFFYITDKNTQNIFVNLVINVSNNDLIQKYANIENAEDYTLTMNIVKPSNIYKVIEGKLHDKEKAIFEFNLSEDCCDEIGTYRCELLTKCNINDHEEITTSNKLTYKVKSSVLNDLDDIVEAPEYPLVIQLFDKLSDIEQYEEDRRANELARQLAEEQRQTRFDTLDADMVDRVTAMDDKMVDVENRVSTKEQAVDTLIVDTKADIDEYKVAKDQEIDDYKTAKDAEINNAIANQDSKIDTAISNQNDKITVVENNDVAQNNRLDTLENRATQHESRLTNAEAKNTEQDSRLDVVENKNQQQDNRLDVVEGKNVERDNRLNEIEAIDVAQNTRLDAIEAKNTEQDDRLLDIEKVNKRQDMNLKCLFAESKNNMIDIAEEGNSIYLQNSTIGYTLIDEIKGNTLVNCNKEPDKELILNGNINASGDNAVTLTEGVDGGKVDVALEGNTLVNVSKTKDSTAITKAYTVENSGNHVALQGDVDGNCRPVVTGNTLVNLASNEALNDRGTFKRKLIRGVSGTFTLICPNLNNFKIAYSKSKDGAWIGNNIIDKNINVINLDDGVYVEEIVAGNTEDYNNISYEEFCALNILILEGDYTDKPIPDYFEGLQSSFEDNLGKYKVEYKTTGKNLFDINLINPKEAELTSTGFIVRKTTKWAGVGIVHFKLKKHTDYIFNFKVLVKSGKANFTIRDDVANVEIKGVSTTLPSTEWVEKKLTWNSGNRDKIALYFYSNFSSSIIDEAYVEFKDIQIEEGNTATSYEPYKESVKTLYLNSPLLEGDTIEEKDGDIYHVHRSELVPYTEGDEASLITDKVNTLHELAKPQYELIEQSNLAIPSYANGHLDFNTAVPVEKVDFLPFTEELTYLYANTQYTVQFVSDKAITADITLGGTQLLAQSIVKGLNRISITTPETLVDNKLIISGVGANISEVVVTDTDRKFGYFEGMKSVGECENLVITSSNTDNSLSNTQQLTHEPLRTVGDTKDKYVMIDGKWFIERKCGEVVIDGSNDENIEMESALIKDNTIAFKYYNDNIVLSTYCDKFMYEFSFDDKEHYVTNPRWVCFVINKTKLQTQDVTGCRQWLQNDPVKVVYKLASPIYELIDYNPLEVYSGTTHITTNSVIPTNITVKNHGYNCLLKPSTTYTISSNLGLNTVTTPSALTEDCLRFMDTDTSDVTTMKDVLVLEGDWTTKADLIPTNFSGIESAFEQEYDAEKGKYKVNIKVANEDKTKENNITFYINEPLRGVGTAKDRIYVKDDKVVVQRNCGIRAYEDGDFGTYPTDKVNTVYPLAEPTYEEVEYNDVKLFIELFKNSTLFYNSNVPVTSKLYYSYSVPIVDTVAQTANVTDQQDIMIIDLATQVAVMEMMLM